MGNRVHIMGMIPNLNVDIGLNSKGLFKPEFYCAYCNTSGEPSQTTYPRCSKCHMVHYHNAKCQALHWKSHKKVCGKPIADIAGNITGAIIVVNY